LLAAAAVSLGGWQDHRPRTETQLFRVTAERIQFDALFLDSQNRPVTDIREAEVTVRQAGAVVPLAALRFQSRVSTARARSVDATRESRHSGPASGATAMAPDETHAWVFLIDDLAMSPDGFAMAKGGLLAMLQREVPPAAVVGILRTGVLGTHQTRLSDDRAELLRAVADMRYRGNRWRGGVMSRSGATVPGPNSKDRVFVEATLGSLNSLLLSLRPLSGRKVVVLLSEMIALTAREADIQGGGGLPTVSWDVQYSGVAQRMRRLGRLASEAGVTVHTVDLAGATRVTSAAAPHDRDWRRPAASGGWAAVKSS
jgi:VWFA-related protein